MTSAYEWIITTRSFHRTRIEFKSLAYTHCGTKYLNYSDRPKNCSEKKQTLPDFNNIPAKAEILKTFSVHNFRKLRQEAGQDIQQFVSVLKSSSKECNFGAAANDEIKQQLISGVRDPKICQELLLMDETATLENVITKAKQKKWSASEQGLMTGTSGSDSGTFGIKQLQKQARLTKE